MTLTSWPQQKHLQQPLDMLIVLKKKNSVWSVLSVLSHSCHVGSVMYREGKIEALALAVVSSGFDVFVDLLVLGIFECVIKVCEPVDIHCSHEDMLS